jgi:hypothetical protein
MLLNRLKSASALILLPVLSGWIVGAQNVRAQVAERAAAIPKVCESVVHASVEGKVDIPSLV